MPELKTYTGGCHCGAVRYSVNTDLEKVMRCNCSICSKTGSLLSFVPAAQFTLESGEDHLSDYQFNRNVIHHLFCRSCGIRSFARGKSRDGQDMVALNVRCLDGVDPDTITAIPVDGRSF